jgi:hypothetical protein
MDFEIIGPIRAVQTIAVGSSIREVARLRRVYGRGRWRKLKGTATIRSKQTDEVYPAEIHWYEASGIGRKEFKVKRRLA